MRACRPFPRACRLLDPRVDCLDARVDPPSEHAGTGTRVDPLRARVDCPAGESTFPGRVDCPGARVDLPADKSAIPAGVSTFPSRESTLPPRVSTVPVVESTLSGRASRRFPVACRLTGWFGLPGMSGRDLARAPAATDQPYLSPTQRGRRGPWPRPLVGSRRGLAWAAGRLGLPASSRCRLTGLVVWLSWLSLGFAVADAERRPLPLSSGRAPFGRVLVSGACGLLLLWPVPVRGVLGGCRRHRRWLRRRRVGLGIGRRRFRLGRCR